LRPSIILFLILVVALLGVTGLYFSDVVPPDVDLNPSSGQLSNNQLPKLRLHDKTRGIKTLSVTIVQGDRTVPLLNRSYPKATHWVKEVLPLQEAGLKDGPFRIQVKAADHAIYHFGAGNVTEEEFQLDFDNTPPVISVLTRAHNLNQGGTGFIIYDLSEDVVRSGVLVGERFFPGHRLANGKYACFFAHPYDVTRKDFSPVLVADDRAGNRGSTGFYFHSNPRRLPESKIEVSARFLQAKMPQFASLFPDAGDPLQLFLKVNGSLRVKNRAKLIEFSAQTADKLLWKGPFLRQPNAAPMGRFGDHRSYHAEGKIIDHQTHLGIDLASVARAPVLAANAGQVVFADFLGIYGNCVVIDHGLGLQTLYGHLSQIDVKTGDEVEKGQAIGRTGATGLAGGDHLHFAVLVGGLPVNPAEWWDASWIDHNVLGKLASIQP